MFHEIDPPTEALTLKQSLIRNVLIETGQRIKAIDDNTGLIAEAETLAACLKSDLFKNAPSDVVTVHTSCLSPSVLICFEMLSTVRAAIAEAGFHIFAEERTPRKQRPIWELTDMLRLTLVGFDVSIVVDSIVDEVVFDEVAA